jgi:MerR family copper efflux transcriptional regulator
MLTIGQLARRVGLRPSALRYYEAEGLLSPSDRTEAGYRLYDPAAADTLRLIQRAQRLGFSLAEIRALLAAWQTGNLDDAALLATAEARYLALERQITEWRVQQHELELFLQDLRGPDAAAAQTAFGRLVDRICANPTAEPPSRSVLDWLAAYSDCPLTGAAAAEVLAPLRGRHVHLWREDDAYYILLVGRDPAVAAALAALARLEGDCRAHPHNGPQLADSDEGHLLIARGDNAFLLARLFLALEEESP